MEDDPSKKGHEDQHQPFFVAESCGVRFRVTWHTDSYIVRDTLGSMPILAKFRPGTWREYIELRSSHSVVSYPFDRPYPWELCNFIDHCRPITIMFNFNRTEDPDTNEKPSLLSKFAFTAWLSDNTTKADSNNSTSSAPNSRAWIKGVVLCSWIIATVLTINIFLTIIAVGLAYSKNGEHGFSFAALYIGKCSLAKNWTTGLHLVINILSTALLGASNYCMQCLASPSREQVDTAHSKRVWLPIGVPNIWGLLWRERGKRQLLGWILLATSLPIHLMLVWKLLVLYN